MRLPRADALVVEQEKVVDYLLNPAHRYGESKARFFAAFGFRIEEWEVFAHALQEHGRSHDVTKVKETGFGPRYEVEGELVVSDGRRPRVLTVWQLDKGEVAPRLITAYPLEARHD
jgi:filamentous hemagglutinin